MEPEEVKQIVNQLAEINNDDFGQACVVGYLYARRYCEGVKDAAPKKDIRAFLKWAGEIHLDIGLLANVLNGHVFFSIKDGEPAFQATAVGKRYVEENLLRK